MPNYTGIQKEETLKSLVYNDFFSGLGYEPDIDNIDFVVTAQKKHEDELFNVAEISLAAIHYLWAEAKKGAHDVFDMFTQLLLTCKKTYEKGEHLAPPWLGAFDEARISFAPFHEVLPIFSEIDFNWTQTPSNHDTIDFKKAREKVKNLIGAKIITFNFGADDADIKEFIKTHIGVEGGEPGAVSIKSPITKDNFVQIFIKWVKEVKPFINISKNEWAEFRNSGILDCDFYRADMLSKDGVSITELKIMLANDKYKLKETLKGRLFLSDIDFTDSGLAYTRFWNKYERPPAEVYQHFIQERRDLLVSKNIREMKGSFFTPAIWADKSKEYLADVFGENWQEEYYIWDCAAGTGNLLAGLANPYNIWASDIEAGNVETMQSLIDIDDKLNLLPAHIFQFDFLNDSFDKLPAELRKIIDDPEKRKKLIVYINPPYAEASSAINITQKQKNKSGVTITQSAHNEYKDVLGKASNEIFSLFMMRVMDKLRGGHLAVFSKLKYVNSSNFAKFRSNFSAKFQKGFICPSDTFDNVNGKFPIGFLIWRLSYNGYDFKFPKNIKLDVYNKEGKRRTKKKGFYNGKKYINKWIKEFDIYNDNIIGFMVNSGTDFLKTNQTYITITKGTRHFNYFAFNKNNLLEGCIYFAVRLCITPSWLNDRDQFLYPNDGWKDDIEFQHDCLIFTLFHGQNRISCADGGDSKAALNHWIPFTEKEVDAKEKFASDFMSKFLKGKTTEDTELHGVKKSTLRETPCNSVVKKEFSTEAAASKEAGAVLAAGRELWRYYHAKIKNNRTASVNASFYDIREFFQGRNDAGKMNNKSNDETYNALIKTLREKLDVLAQKIKPKVYEYGFLKE